MFFSCPLTSYTPVGEICQNARTFSFGVIKSEVVESQVQLGGLHARWITLFVIFFHAIISHDYRFFFEVPPFEESQDPDSSPRREEVGRRTLGEYGCFLLPFFYRARFRLSTGRFSQASKTTTDKPPDTLGTLESTSPRRVLHF